MKSNIKVVSILVFTVFVLGIAAASAGPFEFKVYFKERSVRRGVKGPGREAIE